MGYHSDKTFGATPYIVQNAAKNITVMVDTPKFSKNSVESVEKICGKSGPTYHFITHVDDSSGHNDWKNKCPDIKRIFHSGDLGIHNWIGDKSLEHVEILLESDSSSTRDSAWTLEGMPLPTDNSKFYENQEFVILHTPGHSPGSISLLFEGIILFTGDTLAYSLREDGMSGFPRYGNNLKQQAQTLQSLLDIPWEFVAPGHGKYRAYDYDMRDVRAREIQEAANKLLKY